MSQLPTSKLEFLRPLMPADLPQVVAIESSVYEDPWSEQLLSESLSAPLTYCLGLFERGTEEPSDTLIGYAIFQVILTEGHLLNVAIEKSRQNQGIGGRLLEQICSLCLERGALNLYLEVRPSNPAAIRLYEKQGFRRLIVREKYYANGEDAIVMVADLT